MRSKFHLALVPWLLLATAACHNEEDRQAEKVAQVQEQNRRTEQEHQKQLAQDRAEIQSQQDALLAKERERHLEAGAAHRADCQSDLPEREDEMRKRGHHKESMAPLRADTPEGKLRLRMLACKDYDMSVSETAKAYYGQ